MERKRTKSTTEQEEILLPEIKWKKAGRGSLVLGKRFIRSGQVFMARPDEIPMGFRDVIIALEPIPTVKKITPVVIETPVIEEKPVETTKKLEEEVKIEPVKKVEPEQTPEIKSVSGYVMKLHSDTTDLWDIVNKRGKRLNEVPMTYKDATELLKVL